MLIQSRSRLGERDRIDSTKQNPPELRALAGIERGRRIRVQLRRSGARHRGCNEGYKGADVLCRLSGRAGSSRGTRAEAREDAALPFAPPLPASPPPATSSRLRTPRPHVLFFCLGGSDVLDGLPPTVSLDDTNTIWEYSGEDVECVATLERCVFLFRKGVEVFVGSSVHPPPLKSFFVIQVRKVILF